jgi:hypothetical protein
MSARRSANISGAIGRVTSFVSALLVGLMLSPGFATACSVCTAGRDEENAAAFLISTIFMSLLPLIALGTLLYVIRRRYQRLEADVASRRESETKVGASLASGA